MEVQIIFWAIDALVESAFTRNTVHLWMFGEAFWRSAPLVAKCLHSNMSTSMDVQVCFSAIDALAAIDALVATAFISNKVHLWMFGEASGRSVPLMAKCLYRNMSTSIDVQASFSDIDALVANAFTRNTVHLWMFGEAFGLSVPLVEKGLTGTRVHLGMFKEASRRSKP